MIKKIEQEIEIADEIMRKFATRTGLTGESGNPERRYLWTDAFAVQNFMALHAITDEESYRDLARTLIEEVHNTLGRFAPKDPREGWISGLSGEKGKDHPTISGLRIGKKQLERQESEAYDEQLEWERDGQYFHYHTRWIHALLQAGDFFEEKDLEKYAAELSLAGEKFIHSENGSPRMYWKMSIDLSRPLVPSMGAHDPLEGYLTALECQELAGSGYDFKSYIDQLKKMCRGRNWQTSDPLGIGGLLLNVVRATKLTRDRILPDSVKPDSLLNDAFSGLEVIDGRLDTSATAKFRLAFRECGLSLGLRVVNGYRETLLDYGLDPERLDNILSIAGNIEKFWSLEENRKSPSFQDHLDINEVSLASSLLARTQPAWYGSASEDS